ncbi:hypothetical protein AB5N19_07023 [Seiridium cardinale]|uniref:Uncharacterized protein n=1 Tax=Seiridium cardinale TaxID=138064 RepID=A0ABR2XDZ1_9PEZI
MQFHAAIVSLAALVFANGAMGAAVDTRAALIATDAYSACNCPNNCSHKKGDNCKYKDGPSTNSDNISGHCYFPNSNPYGSLSCIPN